MAQSALSGAQLTTLAQEYGQFASNLSRFLNDNDVPDPPYTDLNDAAVKCATIATNLAVQGAAAVFQDSDKAFSELTSVTTDATHAANALTTQVKQLTRAVSIATGMVGLAAALGSGNVANVISSMGQIHNAIWGSP